MKRAILSLLSLFLIARLLVAQSTPEPLVIEMLPNTQSTTDAPTFYISRHAISPEQYCAFLNAVDTEEGRFYHKEWGDMMRKDWGLLTIAKSSAPPFYYTPINYDTYQLKTEINPATGLYQTVTNAIPKRTVMKGIPMADAARFCNWLAHGQPSGPIDPSITETGSYTFFENRERQKNDSWSTKTIYDPKVFNGTLLKKAYMSVTRDPSATWRLPTRTELLLVLSPKGWRVLDTDGDLWYWTEDAYIKDFPTSMWDPYHTGYTQNNGGYYRVKNGQASGIADLQTHKFQEEAVFDTGFCVVFSANTLPQSGFSLLLPVEVHPETISTNASTLLPPLLPPVLPPPPVLLPPKNP